jgi:hypothetical protein
VSAAAGFHGLTQLLHGAFLGFLLSGLVALGSGFYARYIFRGGRFRMIVF